MKKLFIQIGNDQITRKFPSTTLYGYSIHPLYLQLAVWVKLCALSMKLINLNIATCYSYNLYVRINSIHICLKL